MARRLKQHNVKLQALLENQTVHQAGGTHISPAWIVKIFLTSSSQNARGLTQTFRDVGSFFGLPGTCLSVQVRALFDIFAGELCANMRLTVVCC